MSRNAVQEEKNWAFEVTQRTWVYNIPRLHHFSPEQMRYKAFAGHYDKKALKQFMEERLTVTGTLLEIARHHYEDHQPQLDNIRDSVEMYTAIINHLKNWERVVMRNSNLGEVPVEDLRALEELARDLHPLARRFFPTIGENANLMRFKRFGGQGLRKGIRGLKTREEKPEVKIAEHNPVFDAIEHYISRNERDVVTTDTE